LIVIYDFDVLFKVPNHVHFIYSARRLRSCSPVPFKSFKNDDVQQSINNYSNPNCLQSDEDGEMAIILQIEEIVLLENKINEKTVK
jgi:hypothetical protein